MIVPTWARLSQVWAGDKFAAVFSRLPSGVGMKSALACSEERAAWLMLLPFPRADGVDSVAAGGSFGSEEGRK